jgi:hypothetical protein
MMLVVLASVGSSPADAAPIYLNIANISVDIGPGTSPGTFNNTFADGATIDKAIDAASATTWEFHSQEAHIFYMADVVGGGLELLFDFGIEYDISTLHFWNYVSEVFDVDNVAFTFFNAFNVQVGALAVQPALGLIPVGHRAQDIALAAPPNVRFVTAVLSGTNGWVDFHNIGFTAEVSQPTAVPEPSTFALMALGLAAAGTRWHRSRAQRTR